MSRRATSVSPRQTPPLRPGRAAGRPPAAPRADPRGPRRASARRRAQKHGELERLDQVVVGAAVEAGDAVLDLAAGGEHQHRRPDERLAQAPAGLEAVDPGQHHVEHDRVEGRGGRHPEGVLSAGGDVNDGALLDQAASQQLGHLRLVLDDQHAHRGLRSTPAGQPLRVRDESTVRER